MKTKTYGSAHGHHGHMVLECAFFLIIALASTWPLAENIHDHLPMGMEDAATVPLFNVWTIWWNADRLASGYKEYWDAPIFHPTEKPFSFSEPMPLSALAAPIVWGTGNRILAYNALLLLSLMLNGWAAYSLLNALGFHRIMALIGGAMIELLPLLHSWLGVLQLVPVFGILWLFAALYRFGQHPTLRGGALSGVSYGLVYLLCSYYGLFLALPLVIAGGWLIKDQLGQPEMWAGLMVGILTAALLCLPVAVAQHHSTSAHQLVHTRQYLSQLSADFPDYLFSPWPQLIKIKALAGMERYALFKLNPGWVKVGLALLGTAWGLITQNRRCWTLFCLTLLGSSFVLSLGPLLEISGWAPYMLLVNILPGFAQARNVFRFAVFAQMALALLAMLGLQGGMEMIRRFRFFRLPSMAYRMASVLLIAVGITAVAETLPAGQPLYTVPDYALNHAWIKWLDTRTPADTHIICIPFPSKPDVVSYERETVWMYWQTFHQRKMVNGYSGFFPKPFLDLKIRMVDSSMRELIDHLIHLNVDYCVVDHNSSYGESIRQYDAYHQDIKMVFRDHQARIDIYRLTGTSSGFFR